MGRVIIPHMMYTKVMNNKRSPLEALRALLRDAELLSEAEDLAAEAEDLLRDAELLSEAEDLLKF
jgi:hypothetical protein